ncbi:PB1 domain protein [Oesophagostomum dentatum]|uniref:PB1 domain protein n=1 Tax=Oesophagostomum dentatum TaxID=61180 RepID=A0A0B1T154_OESDE|nr:PB1 domain protein [Oesophagostomum dentatum]
MKYAYALDLEMVFTSYLNWFCLSEGLGTPVTPETFLAWKEKFDKERKALMEKNVKDREAALAGKLTGKQLFLRDATLSLSDVALIEQSVEIDESLFDENGRTQLTPIHIHQTHVPQMPSLLQVKSKFDSEWRRFSLTPSSPEVHSYDSFRGLVEKLHHLESVPFTLCYNAACGDLLPITNDENLRKSFESARPVLRLLIQRKGESWEEKYGYGTDSDRKRKGLSALIPVQKVPKRNYSISNPEDFRQVSAIIDVDIVPEAHRRVRLCKHGSDRPLGFYIRDGTSVRVTERGVAKVQGIFISRLVDGGLAESTGLLGVNDEVLEVNGIYVQGKTLDQVTDMMVANAHNLIITVYTVPLFLILSVLPWYVFLRWTFIDQNSLIFLLFFTLREANCY